MNKVPANAVQGVVLVVDDDLSTRRALRVTLSELGFTVVEAGRGEEALSLVRLTWFDAVLLDVDMPGMGGVETCRAIRRATTRGGFPSVRIEGRECFWSARSVRPE